MVLFKKSRFFVESPSLDKKKHASDVVLHLIEGFLDKRYLMYTYNFYNSYFLTQIMSSRKLTFEELLEIIEKKSCIKKFKKREFFW